MTSTTPGTLQTDLPARMLMIGMPWQNMALLQSLWRCFGSTLPIRVGVCRLHWQYVLMTSTTPGTLQKDLPARMLMIGMPIWLSCRAYGAASVALSQYV